MSFSIDADEQHYFPVAACGGLHLPTGIRATFTPEPPLGCAGCPRYGTDLDQRYRQIPYVGIYKP